jgi:hypothetical protein
MEHGHPGTGWSSPVIWGDRLFLTSVISADKQETPRKGLYFGGNRPEPPGDEHRWMVYCLDWKTGKILWAREVHRGAPKSSRHLKNSYASETPSPTAKESTHTSAISDCSAST